MPAQSILPAPAAGTGRNTTPLSVAVIYGHISQFLGCLPAVTQLRFLPEKSWHMHLVDIISKYAEDMHMHQ